MAKQYDIYVDNLSDLSLGKEVDLTVRDLTPGTHKYTSKYVKAVVGTEENLPEGDVLFIRYQRGIVDPQPLRIKITEDLGKEYKPLPL